MCPRGLLVDTLIQVFSGGDVLRHRGMQVAIPSASLLSTVNQQEMGMQLSRPATVRDVARVASVSVGTVSNFLNGRKAISAPTKTRIEAAIDELRFVPNNAVRVVLGGRSPVIAFVVPDDANPFFTMVARGIEDVAIKYGHVVVSCNTEGETDRERHYEKALAEMRVRAVIAIATRTSDDLLTHLSSLGAQVVSVGPLTGSSKVPSITLNDRTGGKLAAEHLVMLGHSRLAYLGGPGAEPQIRERFAGAVDAMNAAGMDPASLKRIDALGSNSGARMAAAERVLDLRPRPTAVICANDQLAFALESAALRRGLAVPQDIAITGYDDVEGTETALIPITSIHVPQYDIGHAAAQMVFDGVAPEAKFFPTLVVRGSTDPRGS